MKSQRAVRALAALVLATAAAWCQSGNGSVRGTVQDQTRAVIPNASVVLTNANTNAESQTKTNGVGLFVFPAVVPGPYKLAVESAGMQKFEANLTVRVQQSENVDVTLMPAGTQTVVSVADVTPIVTTDNPTLGHILERRRIEQLPINGRSVMTLLNTVPGLSTDPDGDLRTYGTRAGTHDVVLDGAALTDALYGGGTVSRPPSLDSIEEFKVEVNASSAKFTRQTSVIMTTKSGTNVLHGSLFESNRNASIGVARQRENMSNTAAHFVRNEYGGSVGGPVYLPKVYNGKNRTFWFAAYEGYKVRQGSIGGFKVPTEAMRNGDFRGLVTSTGTPIKVYDPYSTDPKTFQRNQFAYNGVPNTIDPSLMSPLTKYMYSVLPLPNRPGVNPLVANNYYAPKPDVLDQWTFTTRIDHRFSEKDNLYGRITKADSKRFRISSGVPTLDKIGNSRTDIAPNKSIAINETHSFSPTFFNEFMFSASRSFTSLATGDYNTKYATVLGLPNPNNQIGFPVINNIGVGTGNSNYFQPQSARNQYFNYFILEDNATKIKGRHELQFGVHLRYDQLTYLPQQQQSGGSVNFPAIATGLYDPAVPNRSRGVQNTGHIAASAFLGMAQYTYRVVKNKYYMRQNEDALYLQDNFKVNQRLTLNLGLRWQFSPYPKDKYDIFSSFDKKNMAIVLGTSLDKLYAVGATSPGLIQTLTGYGAKFETPQQAGLPSRLVNNNWHDIGPHLGFAYRAFDGPKSFIIRGGFSTSYFPVPVYGWNDRMRINAPFTAIYQNYTLTASNQAPDRQQNWGLVGVSPIIAGKNSSTAISLDNPRGISIGGDSFQAAYFSPDQPSSRVHDWNLTLEKEVATNMVMRVAYIGNRATNQDSYDNWNEQIPEWVWYMTKREPLPYGDWYDANIRPYSTLPYGDLQEYRKDGWANSNGAQLEFERRYAKGFGFQVFYNLTNVNKAAGHGWYDDSLVQPVTSFLPGTVPDDRHDRMKLLLYARDTTIPKHQIRWNWIVDLPFGNGKRFGGNASGVLNQIIGGWQISGMGYNRSNYFTLPTDIWPTGTKLEYYGHKYPIQDCRSGECIPGYLMYNGYIPAHLINKPNGIMGVPADYKPAAQPLWPYPANYASLNANNDPNYGYYGSNTVFIKLKDGTTQEVDYGALHPWRNQPIASSRLWGTDASIFKTFSIKERAKLRVQADFFNLFNTPGNEFTPDNAGIVPTNYSMNTPRQLQFQARFTW